MIPCKKYFAKRNYSKNNVKGYKISQILISILHLIKFL